MTRAERMPDFGADGLMPEIPETWSKETEYILDLTKGYHNLLQREEDGNVQSYVWDSVASYRYDEFGTDLSGNQGQFQPFGYTGYQRDAVAGTYYAQAREYDARSGRFTSEDVVKGSAAYPETLNAYGYCWGNPLVLVDRDGKEPEFVPGGDYETIGTDENGVSIIKKKEQYFYRVMIISI